MMIHATMQIYEKAMSDFLPTPSKSHYIFNLRDFARVMRGVLLVPAERMTEPDKLIRLWIHEVYRVFNDRLTDDDDRSVFHFQLTATFTFYNRSGHISHFQQLTYLLLSVF